MLIDSHCHLNMLRSASEIETIVDRAFLAGVQYMQTICTKKSDIVQILDIVHKYQNVFGSIGIHPQEASLKEEHLTTEEILKYLNDNLKIIGIGETGLDFFREYDPELQKQSFLSHIHAAQKSGLPIIIHSRSSDAQISQILKSEISNAHFRLLIHCFTGDKDFLKAVLDLEGYISISGIVTFKNAESLQEIAKYVPIDRLLIETDSPYLAPMPYRGKENEPSFLPYVAAKIAQLKDVSLEEVGSQTSNNFFTLFSRASKIATSHLVQDNP
jgi:TatD DNase family protein